MNWLTLLGFFAKPLGGMINNALSAGSAAVGAWALSKGADAGWVTPAIAGITFAISQAISGIAATQGIQIPVINSTENGVLVVPTSQAKAANISPVDAPLK